MSERVVVTIDTPGPTITIEAHGELDTVSRKALDLFEAVLKMTPVSRAAGFTTAPTQAELANGPTYVAEHEGIL